MNEIRIEIKEEDGAIVTVVTMETDPPGNKYAHMCARIVDELQTKILPAVIKDAAIKKHDATDQESAEKDSERSGEPVH